MAGKHRSARNRPLALLVAGALLAVPVIGGILQVRRATQDPGVSQVATPASPSPSPTASPEPAEPIEDLTNLVAQAKVEMVSVFPGPSAEEPSHELAHPTENGAPLVFLVERQRDGWLRVHLPVRPNGSMGWVREDDVRLFRHDYRMEVRLGAHRLKVFDGDEVVLNTKVAIGTRDTPTPGGTFYIKELLQPPNPDSVYGTYAYGLSGFSNVLTSFAGGEGVIGVHGTNDPSVIGQDVSHGCIRMTNEDIEKLVPILPLGTPVEILP